MYWRFQEEAPAPAPEPHVEEEEEDQGGAAADEAAGPSTAVPADRGAAADAAQESAPQFELPDDSALRVGDAAPPPPCSFLAVVARVAVLPL